MNEAEEEGEELYDDVAVTEKPPSLPSRPVPSLPPPLATEKSPPLPGKENI